MNINQEIRVEGMLKENIINYKEISSARLVLELYSCTIQSAIRTKELAVGQ